MAAFSYEHSPLVFDSFLVPDKLSSLLEDNTIHTTFLSPLCPGDYLQQIPVPFQFHEITSPLIDTTSAITNHVLFTTTDPCVNVRHTQHSSSSSSSTMVAYNEQLESGGGGDDQVTSLVKKREKIKEISKVAKEGKGGRKEKISNAMLKNKVEKKLKLADHNTKAKKKVIDEAPTGFIHVRARRGQATDSHSLAERVRREKISERMRLLQSIVPGCDKITGKAQILDEIINYVQSLQFQVEFLIGKLASVSPMLNDFELDFDTNALLSEKLCSLEIPEPSMLQSSSIQLSPLAEPKPNPIYFLPQQEQKSNIISQDNQIPLWEVNDQRLKFMNDQDEQFNNLSPFF